MSDTTPSGAAAISTSGEVDGPARQPVSPGAWTSAAFSRSMIADYKPFTFVDGPGVRCSVYVSGCAFKCGGCYNAAAQSFRFGNPWTPQLREQILADLAQPYVAGLSLVGGEPLLNTGPCLELLTGMADAGMFEDGSSRRTVWCWTGFTWESLQEEFRTVPHASRDKQELLSYVDVLVDGPFIQSKFSRHCPFRGSTNQRLIDVPASRTVGRAVEVEQTVF